MPDEPNLEDLWIFLLSQPHSRFDLPQLFVEPAMRCAMDQIRQISEKEEKWYRYHSRMMYEHDQATIRQEREALEKDNEALMQDNESLTQQRDQERELRLQLEQQVAELSKQLKSEQSN